MAASVSIRDRSPGGAIGALSNLSGGISSMTLPDGGVVTGRVESVSCSANANHINSFSAGISGHVLTTSPHSWDVEVRMRDVKYAPSGSPLTAKTEIPEIVAFPATKELFEHAREVSKTLCESGLYEVAALIERMVEVFTCVASWGLDHKKMLEEAHDKVNGLKSAINGLSAAALKNHGLPGGNEYSTYKHSLVGSRIGSSALDDPPGATKDVLTTPTGSLKKYSEKHGIPVERLSYREVVNSSGEHDLEIVESVVN